MDYNLQEICENVMSIDKYVTHNKIDINDVLMFEQTWASTSLGFGGFGGSAMTKALTTVLMDREYSYVFFGRRFAYKVINSNVAFQEDLRKFWLVDVKTSETRYK